jgi:hypothetical protein
MATTQDLGLVTSYGYARAGGYRGTVDEYEAYLANLPSYASQAAASATAAAESATTATESATNAQTAYNNTVIEAAKAATSEDHAAEYATNAATSMSQASQYASNASASAIAAASDADDAHDDAEIAKQAKEAAITAKNNAQQSEQNAASSEAKAKSWAVGPSAAETSGSDTNNAKYWCEQAQAVVGLDVFVGATATTNGQQGLVPGPAAGMQNRILFGDATWKALNLVFEGTTQEWADTTNKAFYKIVILTDD